MKKKEEAVNQYSNPKIMKGKTYSRARIKAAPVKKFARLNWNSVFLILLLISFLFFDMRMYLPTGTLLFTFLSQPMN